MVAYRPGKNQTHFCKLMLLAGLVLARKCRFSDRTFPQRKQHRPFTGVVAAVLVWLVAAGISKGLGWLVGLCSGGSLGCFSEDNRGYHRFGWLGFVWLFCAGGVCGTNLFERTSRLAMGVCWYG